MPRAFDFVELPSSASSSAPATPAIELEIGQVTLWIFDGFDAETPRLADGRPDRPRLTAEADATFSPKRCRVASTGSVWPGGAHIVPAWKSDRTPASSWKTIVAPSSLNGESLDARELDLQPTLDLTRVPMPVELAFDLQLQLPEQHPPSTVEASRRRGVEASRRRGVEREHDVLD